MSFSIQNVSPNDVCGLGVNPKRIYCHTTSETKAYIATKDGRTVIHFPKSITFEDVQKVCSTIVNRQG